MHNLNHEKNELMKKVFQLIDDKKREMIKYSKEIGSCHLKLVKEDINLLQSYVSGVWNVPNKVDKFLIS